MMNSKSSSKSTRVLRVRRKIRLDSSNISLEDDFALENQEDVTSFLVLPPGLSLPISNVFTDPSEVTCKSPISRTPINKSQQQIDKNLNKRFTRNSTVKWTTPTCAEYQSRFEETLFKIEEAKKKSEIEEKLKVIQLSPREKVLENREKNILNKYKTTKRYWRSIENNLASKSRKPKEQLLASIRSEPKLMATELSDVASKNLMQDKLRWNASLRDSDNSGKSLAYLRIGSELNELYIRISTKPSEFRSLSPIFTGNESELHVYGISKLPLEIEAAKRVGIEHLKPELINKEVCDEIIAQHIDRRTKVLNI